MLCLSPICTMPTTATRNWTVTIAWHWAWGFTQTILFNTCNNPNGKGTITIPILQIERLSSSAKGNRKQRANLRLPQVCMSPQLMVKPLCRGRRLAHTLGSEQSIHGWSPTNSSPITLWSAPQTCHLPGPCPQPSEWVPPTRTSAQKLHMVGTTHHTTASQGT